MRLIIKKNFAINRLFNENRKKEREMRFLETEEIWKKLIKKGRISAKIQIFLR